jgi:hypothetical protein
MSNSFFLFLPSNTTDYAENSPNKFRCHLPKSLNFSGDWVCGLHSISYPYSWPSTIGTVDDQWISIHFEDGKGKLRSLKIPVGKASHKTVQALRDFIAATLKQHYETLAKLTEPELDEEFMQKQPKSRKRRRTKSKTPPLDEQQEELIPPMEEDAAAAAIKQEQKADDVASSEKAAPAQESKPDEAVPAQQPAPSQQQAAAQESKPEEPATQESKPEEAPPQETATTRKKGGLLDTFGLARPGPGQMSRFEAFFKRLLGQGWKKEDQIDIDRLLQIIHAVELNYHKEFARFQAVFNDPSIKFLSFSGQLGYVLGFQDPLHVKNEEIAKYGCDLKGGFSSFAVYTNGLTENMIIGNTLSSLLRVVTVSDAKPEDYNEKIYDSPIYARVLPKEVSEIEVELRTMDARPVPFAWGSVLLVLLFKKVINF